MADWYCYKDKVKMVDTQLTLRYLELTQDVPGIQCPQCGVGYLTEKVVTTIVQAAEDALEEK
jgi:DNA-directed RNA polymerase subunit RPC12/RpoP